MNLTISNVTGEQRRGEFPSIANRKSFSHRLARRVSSEIPYLRASSTPFLAIYTIARLGFLEPCTARAIAFCTQGPGSRIIASVSDRGLAQSAVAADLAVAATGVTVLVLLA